MKKLTSKDIPAVILCPVAYILLTFACAFLGFASPILWVGVPVIAAFLGAFPMTYLIAKVRKPFIALGTALLWALFILVSGEASEPSMLILPIAVGIIAEVLHKLLGYDTLKGVRFICAVLPLIAFAPIISLWTNTEAYLSAAVEEMGSEAYGETLGLCANAGVLVLIVVLTLIAGYMSTFISGAVFKKTLKSLH